MTAAYSVGIQEAEGVGTVARLEPRDVIAHGGDVAPAIEPQHIGERRLDAEFPGEAAIVLGFSN